MSKYRHRNCYKNYNGDSSIYSEPSYYNGAFIWFIFMILIFRGLPLDSKRNIFWNGYENAFLSSTFNDESFSSSLNNDFNNIDFNNDNFGNANTNNFENNDTNNFGNININDIFGNTSNNPTDFNNFFSQLSNLAR